jgi:tRNA(fMet)-specific endonuclease VapC
VTLWILDTDHLSLLERGNLQVQKRLQHIPPASIAITIITAEEKIKGRLATINSQSGVEKVERLAFAYGALQSTLEDFKSLTILPFSDDARDRYREFLQQRIRVGSHDLRIAAITLSIGGVLVTRNHRDFEKISGVRYEDWSI